MDADQPAGKRDGASPFVDWLEDGSPDAAALLAAFRAWAAEQEPQP